MWNLVGLCLLLRYKKHLIMNLYLPSKLRSSFNSIDLDRIDLVDVKNKADVIILSTTPEMYIKNKQYYANNPNIFFILSQFTRFRKNRHLRKNYAVDNEAELPFDEFKNYIFTSNDFEGKPYIIPFFPGPTPGRFLGKSDNYWLSDHVNLNTNFNNKVFWTGTVENHESRSRVYNFYQKLNDNRFEISNFNESIYEKSIEASVYDNYIDKLCTSDIAYILRGDRAWAHSFHDVIRSGCIPVMVSSMNDYGWENIINNVNDYFLMFDIRVHSMEFIHNKVVELLKDRERVLFMKANIRYLYKTFFHNSANSEEIIIAKCLQIFRNGFKYNMIDNKIICKELLELKNIKEKI